MISGHNGVNAVKRVVQEKKREQEHATILPLQMEVTVARIKA